MAPLLAALAVTVLVGACAHGAGPANAGAGTLVPPATVIAHTVAARPQPVQVATPPVTATPTPVTAAPVTATPTPTTAAPVTAAPTTAAPTTAAPKIATAAAAPDACAAALAYLAAHAAPGFAHFCRPGSLSTALGLSAGYTCVPGTGFSCPDGVAEIIIAAPACPASYQNEASNSHWDFSRAGVIRPGTVQNGRAWDPFGACPRT